MKNYTLFYSNADSVSFDTVVFKAKSLNDAISYAKLWCKRSNKSLLGVIDARTFSNYL